MAEVNTYLDIKDLNKSIGDLILFENASLSIAERQRIGIIGRNGTGKSTLLNIISGKEGYDSGEVVFRRGIKVGFLEQSPEYIPDQTVIEACFNNGNEKAELIYKYMECISANDHSRLSELSNSMDISDAWNYEHRIKEVLSKLNISNFHERMGNLSGGQRKRVALANVLLTEPDMLILDEPTNHLDLQMIEWLEGYLSRGNKTIFMITHDRHFLDKVCDTILELDERNIYTYHGNYAYYLEKRQERMENMKAEIQHSKNLYRKELEWMRRQPQARGHKAKYREDAFYELEKVAKRRIEERQMRLKASNVYIGSKIFECQYVSKAWAPGKIMLKDFYYNFARFEKMGIVGNNGTGKSTFIKMLLGEVRPDSGKFDIGNTVKFGYFSQEGLKFREDQKVIDVITDIAEYIDLGSGRHMTASQFLQYFLFSPEEQHNYVYKLSGGEKRKLYLCTVLMRNPNFLVLDEPTNDLDIQTLQVLEEYLQDFPGCVIIVSHDRYFMDKVVDHLLVFKGNGEIQDFPGNYTQYREWSALQPKESTTTTKETRKENRPLRNETKRKMSYKEKREFEQLEKDIEALEAEKKEIEEALSGGKLSVDDIVANSKRLPILQEELDEKSMRWLELSEIGN